MHTLTIDPEFQALLRALTPDEYAGLERSILEQGCLDAIKVWQPETDGTCNECYERFPIDRLSFAEEGEDYSFYECPACQGTVKIPHPVIIDGHNRYKICSEHHIYFDTADLEFDSRQDALNWIIDYQLEHRNLTPNEQSYLRGKRYNSEKKNKLDSLKQNLPIDQNDPTGSTASKIADELGVSAPTIKRDAKFAEAVDELHAIGGAELKTAILTKELRATKQDVQELAHIAKVTPERGRELIQKVMSAKHPLTTALKEVKREERIQKIEDVKASIEQENLTLSGVYDVIVIDPPWDYAERGGFSPVNHDSEGNRGGVDYPTMTLDAISRIDLPAKDNCVLFLWTTHAFLDDSFDLLKSWGFSFKALIVWDKEIMGIGRVLRLQCEFCLVAVKGSPLINGSAERDIIRETRREHSRKPKEFYAKVERMTTGRKLDYFSREKRDGWDSYGIEKTKF